MPPYNIVTRRISRTLRAYVYAHLCAYALVYRRYNTFDSPNAKRQLSTRRIRHKRAASTDLVYGREHMAARVDYPHHVTHHLRRLPPIPARQRTSRATTNNEISKGNLLIYRYFFLFRMYI